MYFYLVYGLQIQSQIHLPWLQEGGEGKDATIIFGDAPSQLESPITQYDWVQVKENEILLLDERVGRIWVRPHLVVITASLQSDISILASLLLGSGIAALLIWRNHFVLHASAIRLPNGNAIAFSGEKKAGKSTLAGFFYHYGHPLVSDDVCPLSEDATQNRTYTHTGFPRIKLDPAILAAMGKDASDYLRLPLKNRIKHSYPATKGFETSPTPLQAIYLLEEGEATQITKLVTKDAIVELMRNNFRPFFWCHRCNKKKRSPAA